MWHDITLQDHAMELQTTRQETVNLPSILDGPILAPGFGRKQFLAVVDNGVSFALVSLSVKADWLKFSIVYS